MYRMKSDKKAQKYVEDKKVFPLKKTTNAEYYGVEGLTGIWEVRFDIQKNEYRCNCKNIRNTQCSHIKAVQIYKEMKDGKSNVL